MSRHLSGLLTVLVLLGFASHANATVTFAGASSGLSASASFTISGSQLTILLSNTDTASGSGAPTTPSEVLSGLFFNLGTSTFTPVSATLPSGSSIIQTAQCTVPASCVGATNVGGEWSYAAGGGSWLSGTTQGIASSGYLNANTSAGNFGGSNLDGPVALNGIEFGIVPDGWVDYSGNGGLDGNALTEGAVKFVLNIPSTLTEAMIKDVYFTYGTSSTEPYVRGTTTGNTTSGSTIPEPALLSLLGLALIGIGYRARRARR
jgi:hypothetical protein